MANNADRRKQNGDMKSQGWVDSLTQPVVNLVRNNTGLLGKAEDELADRDQDIDQAVNQATGNERKRKKRR